MRFIRSTATKRRPTQGLCCISIHHAAAIGYKDAVVRTPDTDIFVILLHHAHEIKLNVYPDTGSGKHRRLINVTEFAESLGKNYCAALLGYYVWSGEDCTSAFKGKGKVGPLKKLQKNPKFQEAFARLGDEWSIHHEVDESLELFACVMYGHSRELSVNTVRGKMLRKMVGEDEKLTAKSKVDLARLPPCRAALQPHNKRVNHRVALYKRAHIVIIEKPKPYDEGQGWMRNAKDLLEPIWSSKPMTASLIDLLAAIDPKDKETEDEEDMEVDEVDFDAMFESDEEL
ncbi:hypothetical protein V1264_018493 [Littorina saxatilis]|uniref:Uncharacterized protein n=1 Tax=Littorina saxatilis TaxID=31220 RepID=A0AAN9BDP2_9CAEN